MPDIRDARVVIGRPGLNGTGITAGEKTTISNDLASLKGASYIVKTADATLTNETPLSALPTGLLKVTTGTGDLSTATAADLPAHTHTIAFVIPFVLDGAGSAIPVADVPPYGIYLPFDLTYTGYVLEANGAISLSVQRALTATPTTYDSIHGTERPLLASAGVAYDVSLTTWAQDTVAGTRLRITVDSATATAATFSLLCTRTI